MKHFDFIVNIIYWIGFSLTITMGFLGVVLGLAAMAVVSIAAILLFVIAAIICVVPFLPFICWCSMFERHRWDSFIRSITKGRMTSAAQQPAN